MYVLYTSKYPTEIVDAFESTERCYGSTVILSANDCDSFRESVPVKDINQLPSISSYALKVSHTTLYDRKKKQIKSNFL